MSEIHHLFSDSGKLQTLSPTIIEESNLFAILAALLLSADQIRKKCAPLALLIQQIVRIHCCFQRAVWA